MQSNLIVKNTVKQKSLFLYLQLIIMNMPENAKSKYPPNMGSDVFKKGLNILMSFYTKIFLSLP